jgi:hypothetical protein
MDALKVSLFQPLQGFVPEGEEIGPGSLVARCLSAYLFLNRERPTDRRFLAFLYWPVAVDGVARRDLLQRRRCLRRSIEPAIPGHHVSVQDPAMIILGGLDSIQRAFMRMAVRTWLPVPHFRSRR